jgi:predicted nucleotidyltransferase
VQTPTITAERFDELRGIVIPMLRPYVKKIAVFGSFARGEDTAGSDIDLLVTLRSRDERPPLGLRWVRLEQELSAALGREVDLVSDAALSPYLRPYVEEDKVVLYEER